MIPLLTSRRQQQNERPPDFPWVLNEDCAQAQGLVAFWPLGYESSIERDAKGTYNMTVNGPSLDSCSEGLNRSFVRASSQYLQNAAAVITASPLTMACWFRSDDVTNRQVLMSLSTTGVTSNAGYDALEARGDVAIDPLRYVHATDAGSAGVSTTTTGYTAGGIHHGCAVRITNTSKAVYIDGGSKGTNTQDRHPSAPDVTSIGCTQGTTRALFFSGQLWHACIWGRPLFEAEVAGLYDPSTRWELYYPIGRKTWSFAPAAAAGHPAIRRLGRVRHVASLNPIGAEGVQVN